MSLEGFGAPVVVVPTDLTVVVDVEPVELVQPVRDRLEGQKQSANEEGGGWGGPGVRTHLAVPAQRQVLGVVDDLVVLVFALALAQLLLLLLLPLLSGPGLFPLDVLVSQLPLLLQPPGSSR